MQEEILYKLKLVENELLKRKSDDFLSHYNKGGKKHKKQMQFHKCNKKNRWVFGGNRSGKTECGAVETVWLARGIHTYKKINVLIVGWCRFQDRFNAMSLKVRFYTTCAKVGLRRLSWKAVARIVQKVEL